MVLNSLIKGNSEKYDEKYDGNVRLKFTPKVLGAYSPEVKIDGDKLPACPITVQVEERELVVVGELIIMLFPGDTLERLYGVVVNTEGQIVVTDNLGNCVYVFDKDGNCMRKIGSKRSHTGQFQFPNGISFFNDNEVLIIDLGNCRIQRVNIQTGTVVKSFGKEGRQKGEFGGLIDVTVDDDERIVVTEWGNNRILPQRRQSPFSHLETKAQRNFIIQAAAFLTKTCFSYLMQATTI